MAKLEEEGKPLEVVHTVELKEVRENLSKWFPSAFKERENLVKTKKAFRVMKKHELPPAWNTFGSRKGCLYGKARRQGLPSKDKALK